MTSYAEKEFALERVQPDGTTTRDNLLAVERATGKRPAALETGEIPDGGEHIWGWFCQLHSRRPYGPSGPLPIPWSEILAWATLTGNEPLPWEVELIQSLDNTWFAARAK